MTLSELLQKCKESAASKSNKGALFERVIKLYFLTDKLYSSQIEEVYLWEEFPYRTQFGAGHDIGIDLVIKTLPIFHYSDKDPMGHSEYWAVQCKFYGDENVVSKKGIDSFLSVSGKTFNIDNSNSDKDAITSQKVKFSRCYIVYTGGSDWSKNAESDITNRDIPVIRIYSTDLEKSNVDWDAIYKGFFGDNGRQVPRTPYDFQKEALNKALDHYKTHDRGKLIMACGTGKTYTSLLITESLLFKNVDGENKSTNITSINSNKNNQNTNDKTKGDDPKNNKICGTKSDANIGKKRLVLFLVPSIALINQSLRAWYNDSTRDFDAICVCSDSKVSRDTVDILGITSIKDLARPASTNSEDIKKSIECAQSDFIVVFNTYQSLNVVHEAQSAGALGTFDLIICDEAHRTTGFTTKEDKESDGASNFVRVHDNGYIKGKKRLYMTATPRIYSDSANTKAAENDADLYSMDNEALFGAEFYKIGFSEAVRKKLLSPYKVVILTVTGKDVSPGIMEIISKQQEAERKALEAGGKGKKVAISDLTREFAAKLAGTLCALSKQFTHKDETTKLILEQDSAPMKRAIAFLPKIGEYDNNRSTLIKDKDGTERIINCGAGGNGSKGASDSFMIVAQDFVGNLQDRDMAKKFNNKQWLKKKLLVA